MVLLAQTAGRFLERPHHVSFFIQLQPQLLQTDAGEVKGEGGTFLEPGQSGNQMRLKVERTACSSSSSHSRCTRPSWRSCWCCCRSSRRRSPPPRARSARSARRCTATRRPAGSPGSAGAMTNVPMATTQTAPCSSAVQTDH